MMGIILRMFIDYVSAQHSDQLLDDLLGAAKLPSGGAYTSYAIYCDSEYFALVEALANRTGQGRAGVQREFGRYAFDNLAAHISAHKASYPHIFDLLQDLKDKIHADASIIYEAAPPVHVQLTERTDRSAIFHYRSSRPCAQLALGLLEGALLYYGHTNGKVEIIHSDGDLDRHIDFKVILDEC